MDKVFWRDEALADLARIRAYIRQFDEAAAERIARRLIACGESLDTFPHRGRPIDGGRREMTNVPPYVLTYIAGEDAVEIVAIRHGARDVR